MPYALWDELHSQAPYLWPLTGTYVPDLPCYLQVPESAGCPPLPGARDTLRAPGHAAAGDQGGKARFSLVNSPNTRLSLVIT